MTLIRSLILKAATSPRIILLIFMILFCGCTFLWVQPFLTINHVPTLYGTDAGLLSPADNTDPFPENSSLIIHIINPAHPDGVINTQSLEKIYSLQKVATELVDQKTGEKLLVTENIIGPGTVELMRQDGLGKIRFYPLATTPPETASAAKELRTQAMNSTEIKGILIAEDGKAIALYFPLASPHNTLQLQRELKSKIASFPKGTEQFFFSGPPLSLYSYSKDLIQQTFLIFPGILVLMFIFMWLLWQDFWISCALTFPAMVAMSIPGAILSLLPAQYAGFHFLLPLVMIPITLLQSLALISFFCSTDKSDKKQLLLQIKYRPLLLSSLAAVILFTSPALFFDQPSLQTFSLVMGTTTLLSLLIVLFVIPACIVLSTTTFEHCMDNKAGQVLTDHLNWARMKVTSHFKIISAFFLVVSLLGIAGFSLLDLDDRPNQRFSAQHHLRQSENHFNRSFAGAEEVRLRISGIDTEITASEAADWLKTKLKDRLYSADTIYQDVVDDINRAAEAATKAEELAESLLQMWNQRLEDLELTDDLSHDMLSIALDTVEQLRNQHQIFTRPELLHYLERLQDHLANNPNVGKIISIVDISKGTHRELFESDPGRYTIPYTANGVLQTFTAFSEKKSPYPLSHYISANYDIVNMRIFLRTNDKQTLKDLTEEVNQYTQENIPPLALSFTWSGQGYRNIEWQTQIATTLSLSMVFSLAVITLLLALSFTSPVVALIVITPTIALLTLIYGIAGPVFGHMDISILLLGFMMAASCLSLCIHQMERVRQSVLITGSWQESVAHGKATIITMVFLLVFILSFIPLAFSPLIPLKFLFLYSLLGASGSGCLSLWLFPSLILLAPDKLLQKYLQQYKKVQVKTHQHNEKTPVDDGIEQHANEGQESEQKTMKTESTQQVSEDEETTISADSTATSTEEEH